MTAGSRARVLARRAPLVFALALVLAAVGARSSLARLLPLDVAALPGFAWLFVAILAALVPALAAKGTPLPGAALVAVPVLVAGSYGASRLDWLRVLKDFGVAETTALDPLRLALSTLALVLLWTLHASDMATRFRLRAIERGIDVAQARAASRRMVRRSAQAAALALAGGVGLLLVGILGVQVGARVPTERAALVAPLVASAALVLAALYLARGSRA